MNLLELVLICIISLTTTGCSYVEYKGNPDGSTTAYAYTFASENGLNGFKAQISPTGERKISIKELSSDHVEGMKEINQGLSLIIEGAAKAAK